MIFRWVIFPSILLARGPLDRDVFGGLLVFLLGDWVIFLSCCLALQVRFSGVTTSAALSSAPGIFASGACISGSRFVVWPLRFLSVLFLLQSFLVSRMSLLLGEFQLRCDGNSPLHCLAIAPFTVENTGSLGGCHRGGL